MEKTKLQVFIKPSQLSRRIKQLAADINHDYRNKIPIFIGVLNGAFIFMSDLIREIDVKCEVDFLKLSSYGDSKISSGEVKTIKELNCDVKGRDVIIVEDIIDSGLSMKYMLSQIKKHKPKSVRLAALLHKKDVAKIDFKIDYLGFAIDNKFVVGYGLDFAQRYRNLKGIYVL
ncbi:MAG: hypoxanthine phosphoribosyltransferase [Ignavibacteriae bacterium]|nr:hypoxanthine phosphoribosyltransferase [Ignavibacteriota bacterium]